MKAEERPSKLRKIEHVATGRVDRSLEAHQPPYAEEHGGFDLDPVAQDDGAVDRTEPSDIEHGITKALSKNAQKKLRKHEEWEAKRPAREAKKREQRRAKKERDKLRRRNEDEATKAARAALRRDGTLMPVTIVFDCGYDDLMREKEIVSLGSQLTRCYSENRNSSFKAHLAVSSFGGRLKERFDTVLKGSYKSWNGFTFSDAPFDALTGQLKGTMDAQRDQPLAGAFSGIKAAGYDDNACGVTEQVNGEVVYLSSDSDYTLKELKPFGTYIIGGLVDRNRCKGRCYKAAKEKGVRTARLPIGEYLEMSTRHILTTNHVLEIMLKWLELGNWGAAFTQVIPKRKGGVLKIAGDSKLGAADIDCVIAESGDESDEDSDEESEGSEEQTALTIDGLSEQLLPNDLEVPG